MPTITYLPSDFWGVAFTRLGSALPKVAFRSVMMGLPALLAAVVVQWREEIEDSWCPGEQCIWEVPSSFVTPFALLISLLTSYRVNNAHLKYTPPRAGPAPKAPPLPPPAGGRASHPRSLRPAGGRRPTRRRWSCTR